MLELLNSLRQLLYTVFQTGHSVKRSAPLDEPEYFTSAKMRRLSRPYSDELFSSSSSDNSRRFTSSKKLSNNYPVISLDDDDDEVIEIQDVSDRRKTVQHTSTPVHNDIKDSMNGQGASAYFSSGNSASARKSVNGTGTLDATTNMLKKRSRDSFTIKKPPARNSVIDLTFRLDEKMRYNELLEKSSLSTTFNSSTDSKYHTPVGKYFSIENFRGRQMVDACKARQKVVDSIDLTRGSAKRNRLRKSTSTTKAGIRVLDDFDDAIVVKDSDSDVEILSTPPSPKPDFKVERVNSMKWVMDTCEFSDPEWLEEQNEKLRQKRESKQEKWQELQKCTRQLNQINKDIEQKCLEELVRDSLTIKDYYIIPELEKEEEVEFLPLTDEQELVVTKALQAGKDQVVASKFNLKIYGMDIATLRGTNWLNDNVINFYMNLIIERGKNPKYPAVHAFNTFFYPKLIKDGYSSIRRWTKKVDIFSYNMVAVPIHLQVHWCMAIVNFRDKSIRYYDSMGHENTKCLEALYGYLKSEHWDKKGSDFDMSGWQLESVSGDEVPQQMNGSDCGMFSCTFAEFLTRNAKLTFGQQDMPYLRRKMVYEIVTGQLVIS